jgi:ACT domain-containing protein
MRGNILAKEVVAVRYSASPRGLNLPGGKGNMVVGLPETTSKIGGPQVRQFSVFLPNKVGAMLDIVKLLNAHATHVVALSVSESTDSAIARLIVSDPERVEVLFHENDIPFGTCDLMVVELREVATQLIKLLAALLMAEVNVHFSYPLLTRPNGRAALAMCVDDTECATSVLLGEGFRLLSQADISR